MSEVCAKHVKTPAFIYGACIGCELEGLRAETQALREELKNRTAECNGLHEMLRQEHDRTEKARGEVVAANDRADTLEHRMMGMMTRHFAESWRNRDTTKELDGYLSSGIAALERERDAALAEVAALRARVVVADPVQSFDKFFAESGQSKYRDTAWWNFEAGFNLARLNGKAVSEELLYRIADTLDDVCHGSALEKELRALLGEGKEHE